MRLSFLSPAFRTPRRPARLSSFEKGAPAMLFSSVTFCYLFLPAVLLVYAAVPGRGKNYVLLGASLLFYFFGEPSYTVLLAVSSLSDYLHSLYIEKHRGTRRAKLALASSILINLGMLCFFKYTDFFLGSLNSLLGLLQVPWQFPLLHLRLPIGISFFTFQTMSYTIDVYRGKARAQKNFATLATFVCLFPQLVAGPIVRYTDISAELEYRKHSLSGVSLGVRRFVLGLGKKVLLANAMGELCAGFSASGQKDVLFFWLGALAYCFQIYFDFSGYSDMAIGLGRLFGFTFPENFNYPYLSQSITEFWRRWHITLGSWFRDYVYIPLGGNRVSRLKWVRNLLIVWALTGLWHGAAWNFLLWGLFFGAALAVEKLWLGRYLERAPRAVRHLYTLFLVLLSFVLFSAGDLREAWAHTAGLFGYGAAGLAGPESLYALRSYAVTFLLCLVGCTPLPAFLFRKLDRGAGAKVLAAAEPLALGALLLLCTAFLVDGSFNPFLYFRF